MVPAPLYFTALAILIATSPIFFLVFALIKPDGASSITFWCRLCIEHSRSNRCSTLPWESAMSCISMCLGCSTNLSTYTESSPNADLASLRAMRSALSKSSFVLTSLIPFPPPPADAFIMSGYPISPATTEASTSLTAPSEPGTSGTLASYAIFLAVILSPISLMASGDGPMKTIPAFSHISANSAFSDRNPNPG